MFKKLSNIQNCVISTLPTSSQPLSGYVFKSRYTQNCVFGPKCPNMVIWPQTAKNDIFLIFFIFTRSDLPIRFQQAIDHYQVIISTQNIPKNVILAENAQIC